jgi:hypothetical protein
VAGEKPHVAVDVEIGAGVPAAVGGPGPGPRHRNRTEFAQRPKQRAATSLRAQRQQLLGEVEYQGTSPAAQLDYRGEARIGRCAVAVAADAGGVGVAGQREQVGVGARVGHGPAAAIPPRRSPRPAHLPDLGDPPMPRRPVVDDGGVVEHQTEQVIVVTPGDRHLVEPANQVGIVEADKGVQRRVPVPALPRVAAQRFGRLPPAEPHEIG